MTTTNKQLQDWLKRFPDDALIEVITSEEYSSGWSEYISVYHEDLELPDVTMSDLTSWGDFGHVSFDVKYDYDKGGCTDVKSITLGKAHND